jgi:hypothetical protein
MRRDRESITRLFIGLSYTTQTLTLILSVSTLRGSPRSRSHRLSLILDGGPLDLDVDPALVGPKLNFVTGVALTLGEYRFVLR